MYTWGNKTRRGSAGFERQADCGNQLLIQFRTDGYTFALFSDSFSSTIIRFCVRQYTMNEKRADTLLENTEDH